MKTLVAYADRTGAGSKAAREIASLLGTEAVPIEPTSKLVRMSWLAMLDESCLQAWEPLAGDFLVVVIEDGRYGLGGEVGGVLFRTRVLRSGYALVVISRGGAREPAALIERTEAAAGRRPLAYAEASAGEVMAEGRRKIWRTKMERLRLSLMK